MKLHKRSSLWLVALMVLVFIAGMAVGNRFNFDALRVAVNGAARRLVTSEEPTAAPLEGQSVQMPTPLSSAIPTATLPAPTKIPPTPSSDYSVKNPLVREWINDYPQFDWYGADENTLPLKDILDRIVTDLQKDQLVFNNVPVEAFNEHNHILWESDIPDNWTPEIGTASFVIQQTPIDVDEIDKFEEPLIYIGRDLQFILDEYGKTLENGPAIDDLVGKSDGRNWDDMANYATITDPAQKQEAELIVLDAFSHIIDRALAREAQGQLNIESFDLARQTEILLPQESYFYLFTIRSFNNGGKAHIPFDPRAIGIRDVFLMGVYDDLPSNTWKGLENIRVGNITIDRYHYRKPGFELYEPGSVRHLPEHHATMPGDVVGAVYYLDLIDQDAQSHPVRFPPTPEEWKKAFIVPTDSGYGYYELGFYDDPTLPSAPEDIVNPEALHYIGETARSPEEMVFESLIREATCRDEACTKPYFEFDEEPLARIRKIMDEWSDIVYSMSPQERKALEIYAQYMMAMMAPRNWDKNIAPNFTDLAILLKQDSHFYPESVFYELPQETKERWRSSTFPPSPLTPDEYFYGADGYIDSLWEYWWDGEVHVTVPDFALRLPDGDVVRFPIRDIQGNPLKAYFYEPKITEDGYRIYELSSVEE